MFYFLFGTDTYSIKKKTSALEEKFKKEAIGLNILKIDGNALTKESYINAVLAVSLFAEKKLVIIQNIFDNSDLNFKKYLAENISKIPAEVTVIFSQSGSPDKRSALFKALKEPGKFAEFNDDDLNKTARFIEQKISQSKLTIERQAQQILVSLPCDLWFLENSLEKLILMKKAAGETAITIKDLDAIITVRQEPKLFELTEAIAKKNAKAALKIFHELLVAGNNEIMLFAMIVNQERKLLIIHDLLSRGKKPAEIASELKIHPFVLKKNQEILKNYPLADIKSDFLMLQEVDVNLKNGSSDNQALLDLTIVKLCS